MKPLVSIIIPAYNASKTINKCVESALKQTIKEVEVIVINDKSKDDTLDKLKEYGNKIILINNAKNLGPSESRNKGIEKARGKYIFFLDSDDYIADNTCELMSSKMTDEVDLVVCSRFDVTSKGKKAVINENTDTDAKAFTKTSNYATAKLYKKSIIDKHHIKFPKQYSYAEDFYFQIKYRFYANKMIILREPLYYYLKDSEGSITNSYSKNLFDIIKVLQDIIDFFKKNNVFEKYEDELVELCAGFYVRRIREFKNYNDKEFQRRFVKEFLEFFANNFTHYKHQINGFKTKYYRFYRSSYSMMLIYIELQQLRRKK